MFDNIKNFFKKFGKNDKENSKSTAKERLHLVLAQDRANISADFLEMMKQEIIEVIKKYIDKDEEAIDVKMTNKPGEDGTVGAPALYANIPIVTIKNEARKLEGTLNKTAQKEETVNNEKNDKTENIETSNENRIDDDKKESKEEEKAEDTAELNTDGNEIQEEKISESEDKKENLEEEANEEKNT